LRPLDVAQPLQPGRPPAGLLDQADDLVRVDASGQRQLGDHLGVVAAVMVVRLAAQAAPALAGPLAQVLDRVDATPEPLEQHQPAIRRRASPGGQRGRRVRERPQQVALDHRVERPWRRLLRPALDDLDRHALLLGRLAQARQHAGRQVDGGDLMAEARGRQRQEPGARAGVEDAGGRRWQQARQGRAPGGPLRRRRGAVVR
jgi:hypothetical protein